MKIQGIIAPFGLDLSQLNRDIEAAATQLVQFSQSDAITDAQNLSLSAKSSTPESGQDQTKGAGEGATAGLSSIGSKLASAMAPLQGLGSRIAVEFDRVGGTIVELARRIDAAMRFPAFDAAMGAISAKLIGVGVNSAKAFGALVVEAQKATNAAFKVSTSFGVIVGAASTAATVISGRFLAIVGGASAAAGAVTKIAQAAFRVANYFGSLGDVAGKLFSQMFKLGTLNVFRAPEAGAKALTSAVETTSASVRNLGRDLLAAVGVFGLAFKAVEFFKGAIVGASDLGETLSKTEVRFGEATGEVVKFADQMASQFGIVKQETLDAAAGFGGLGKSLANLSGNELAEFSNKMTQLAADMSSQENKGFKEMSDALKIGLAGNQSDVLREMGVIITDTNVKAYALANGIAKNAKEMTEAEKVTARMGLIMSKTKDAQGDLARTADSTANQFRKAGGGLQNFAVSVGEMLLPAVNAGTAAFNGLLATMIDVFEANKERVAGFANGIKTAFEGVSFVLKNFGILWEITVISAGANIENLVRWFQVIPANLKVIGNFLATDWRKVMFTAVDYVLTLFVNLGTNLQNLAAAVVQWFKDPTGGFKFEWTNLTEGFHSSIDKLPEMIKPVLVNVQDQIDELTGKLTMPEAVVAKVLPKGAADDATGAGAEKDAKDKVAGLAEMGSKESFKAIALFQNRAAGKDPTEAAAKDTAKNTGKMADGIDKLVSMMPNFNAVPSLEMMGI